MNNKMTSDQTNNRTTDDQTIMREVIEECQNKGYLVSFLEKHRNELENIMIEEMEYAESFDEYMERSNNEAVKKAEPRIAKEAVKKAEPRIAKEAVKKAEPEIVRNYVDKLHRYLNRFKEGKMTKEAAAQKLNMTLAQFETLFC